ncbi:hypothetical protein IC620_02830 [Hazenella sp. IB182357]|uniref:YlaH-like protein n=2 Tax=Polycladospora coralii TaxID=2771432 RepID=A0A926N7T2_9BACL|nr:YlaH-like family protein [Polycladospora coralii]MBD1371287.1 hypothetical protein [Polycladospora coralii]MBS7530248.1 hypothetical protein [Polycladospora coralii]
MIWINELPYQVVYLIIVILASIVYKLAFARKLPLLKSIMVYIFLAIGCVILFVFHYMGFPIMVAMLLTIIMVVVTRVRLSFVKRD